MQSKVALMPLAGAALQVSDAVNVSPALRTRILALRLRQ
jgi:hypothetical protein